MTEIERLINEGFISSDFLCQEERNEYIIPTQMKKTWAIQMDLLRELVKVCERYNLKVWVIGGTLLGTVRHRGFIPWDDDIDVIMPREDYDKLLSIGNTVFTDPYFLQSPFDTEMEVYFPTARLCNSNTFLDHNVCALNEIRWNSGIFIDIFVLDGVPRSKSTLRRRFSLIKWYTMLLHAYVLNINKHWLARLAHNVLRWPIWRCKSNMFCKKIHNIARKTQNKDSLIATPYSLEHNIFDSKDFRATEWLSFENIRVPVPIGYDAVLKVSFGDYMQLPPKETRGVWHHFDIDPDIPYLEVIRNASR